MKPLLTALLSTIFLGCLAGCASDRATYIRNVMQRAVALSGDGIGKGITVHDSRSAALEDAADQEVIVLARLPKDSPSVIQSDSAKQVIEGALIQGLHHKGYRTASRLNVHSVLEEKAFSPRKLDGQSAEWFKGSAMLVVTVNRLQLTSEKYETAKAAWSSYGWNWSGNLVNAHLSAELFAADSSESLWSASAQLNEFLLPSLSADFVLEAMVHAMTSKLPPRPVRRRSE